MIYLSVNSDGKNTEGIGAMAQAQLLCYAISRSFGVGFHFSKFENLTHYQHYDVGQEEFIDDANRFFNFPSLDDSKITRKINLNKLEKNTIDDLRKSVKDNENVVLEFDQKPILKFFVKNGVIKEAENKSTIRSLKSNLFLEDKFKQQFSIDEKNIAIHIRKYTSTDSSPDESRDLFVPEKKQYYTNLLERLSLLYENQKSKFRIYAQGSIDEYEFLNSAKLHENHTLSFHIEEYPIVSLYYMINADVLVMANSSFSWISHLYGNHELVCMKQGFNHPMYSLNLKEIDKNGNLIL